MTVYKPKNSPFYHFDFQFRGARYYGSTNCETKRDAMAVERDERRKAATGVKQKPSISVDDGFGLYWDAKGRFDKASSTTEYQLANLSRLLGKSTLLHDMDDLTIADMVARRRGETARNRKTLISNASVNREVELLKRVQRHLDPRYKMPEIDWGKHRLKEPKERVREASVNEENSLFATLRKEDDDLAALVEFAMLSGARKDAVVTLLWSKVDLQKCWAEVRTKGDIWHGFPLSPRMVQIVAERPKVGPRVFTYVCRQTRKAHTDKLGRKHPGRVRGERYPFSKQGWDKRWRKVLADAGIINFRFHDLRHTAATRITRVAGIKAAQKLLGHADITTTARYAHVSDDDLRTAMLAAEESRNSPEAGRVRLLKHRRNSRHSG